MKEPVGHFLLEWRKSHKLTQGQVAEGIGFERSYYSRIETGKRGYDQDILGKLAQFYGIEPRDLIGRDPNCAHDLWAIVANLHPDDLVRLTGIAQTLRQITAPGTPVTAGLSPAQHAGRSSVQRTPKSKA